MLYVGHLRTQRDQLAEKIDNMTTKVQLANDALVVTKANVEKLINLRENDAVALTSLGESQIRLTKKFNAQTDTRKQLESSNVNVQKYLNEPVPIELSRMLDEQNARYRVEDGSQNLTTANAAVPRSAAP